MKILVTGSKGFIGKNLIRRLKEEKDILIFECDKDTDSKTLEVYCKKQISYIIWQGLIEPIMKKIL